jgi:hypothetical protein
VKVRARFQSSEVMTQKLSVSDLVAQDDLELRTRSCMFMPFEKLDGHSNYSSSKFQMDP